MSTPGDAAAVQDRPARRGAPSPRVRSLNAALTLFLLACASVLATMLVSRHADLRVDLSEDGLYTLSDATRSLVERVDDPVTVRLFATEEIQDGTLALRTARIRAQLDEIIGLAPGRFELIVLDPSRSSQARQRAIDSRFQATAARTAAMGRGSEEVWLSLELGYRGRVQRIPVPRPAEFELQFASSLHSILADRRVGIGWYGAPINPAAGASDEQAAALRFASSFSYITGELRKRGRFFELFGIEDGRGIPEGIDVLFVVRPGRLEERAVYELDQFVQRGGRLVVCLDQPDYHALSGQAILTGTEDSSSRLALLLRRWGIGLASGHVWDDRWGYKRRHIDLGGGGGGPREEVLDTPLVIRVPEEGLSQELPPSRGLPGVVFSWAHPLDSAERLRPPAGVTRTDLAWTSDRAWLQDVLVSLPRRQSTVRNLVTAVRSAPATRFALAAVFEGRFPSPWAGREAPAPVDPLGLDAGGDEEVPRSAEVSSQVVVFGDADWLRDPDRDRKYFTQPFVLAGGDQLALNLVDWLVLDDELIELRSRAPRPRPLRDFVAENAEELGVFEADPYETSLERAERNRLMDVARSRARRRQWTIMAMPALGALLVLGLFGAAWNGLQRPGRRRSSAQDQEGEARP